MAVVASFVICLSAGNWPISQDGRDYGNELILSLMQRSHVTALSVAE